MVLTDTYLSVIQNDGSAAGRFTANATQSSTAMTCVCVRVCVRAFYGYVHAHVCVCSSEGRIVTKQGSKIHGWNGQWVDEQRVGKWVGEIGYKGPRLSTRLVCCYRDYPPLDVRKLAAVEQTSAQAIHQHACDGGANADANDAPIKCECTRTRRFKCNKRDWR